jgi:Reverse transcriptase (RNA-dependent DNA polymerase)
MPQDAPVNTGAHSQAPAGSWSRVAEMQAKLHRWAAADPGRRFDDLFNFVHDPATLKVAFGRVAGNRGANTPGVDGLRVADVEEAIGVPGFLDGLRTSLKDGSFRPLPVRERKIPKPGGSGKVRRLGIPVIADRVVQAALKLVLEPIFEADFLPVSYGFRPMRRAHDAVAEIQRFGTKGYQWVLDADIEACFDTISHSALMDRVRTRVKDKPVPALVKDVLIGPEKITIRHRIPTHVGGHSTSRPDTQPDTEGDHAPGYPLRWGREITCAVQYLPGPARSVRRTAAAARVRPRPPPSAQPGVSGAGVRHRAGPQAPGQGGGPQACPAPPPASQQDPADPSYRRLRYVRYADDWLLGVRRSQARG